MRTPECAVPKGPAWTSTFGIKLAGTRRASIAIPADAQNVRMMPPLDPANRELTMLL
jgi:hypothetical protein